MSIVQGKNVLLKVYRTDGYYSIACNASCTLDLSVDEIESTFLGSGAQKTYIPGRVSQTLKGNGPIYLSRDISASDVYSLAVSRQPIQWSFEMTDNDNNVISYSGGGFFTSVSITGDVNNAATCDYTIRVSGDVTASNTLPGLGQDDVSVYMYTATGGETTISNSVLIGSTVIDVERNGIGLIVVSSSPNTNQVQFNSSTGSLTFDYALGAGEYIQVIYLS